MSKKQQASILPNRAAQPTRFQGFLVDGYGSKDIFRLFHLQML
jgi:hypothetical protein